jgi:hypothetical protein
MFVAIAMFCGLAVTAIRVGAQSVNPTSDTYSWSGELVAFDPQRRTVDVKSPVVGDQALLELPKIGAPAKIILTWSGFDTYADAILRAVRYQAGRKWSEPFTFPVEFVAYDPPRRYVTFRFAAPADSVDVLQTLEAGEWITVTTRHRPATEADAIAAVHPYAAAAARRNTH